MKKIKCRFKGLTGNDKLALKGHNGLLTISIGQDTQDNKRFIAMLDLMMDTFDHCTIALHDTLQRHTMAMQTNSTANACYNKATAIGDRWLETNEQLCKKFGSRINIIRWEDWIQHPDFEKHKAQIIKTMNNDDSYNDLFYQSIHNYLNRYVTRLNNPEIFNRQHAEQLCIDYLIEECAALCLWPTTDADYEIYDGTHNAAMQETRKRFVHATTPNKIRSLNIVFNHRPDLKPQKLQ
jgi:hypothetical protein